MMKLNWYVVWSVVGMVHGSIVHFFSRTGWRMEERALPVGEGSEPMTTNTAKLYNNLQNYQYMDKRKRQAQARKRKRKIFKHETCDRGQ